MVNSINIKKGDIVYVDLGNVIGSEQGGIRPCLVVQNDIGNLYAPTTIVAPLTSRLYKKEMPTHLYIDPKDSGLLKGSIALFEQVRIIDKSRIKDKVGKVMGKVYNQIDECLMISFGIKPQYAYAAIA